MVGPLESPLVLLPEYESATSPGFLPGIRYIGKQYTTMRRIRRDGNCFYRAFLFAYLDNLVKDYCSGDATNKTLAEEERMRILQLITGSKDELIAMGYSEMAIESFHDVLVELITDLFTNTTETLLANFQEDGQSDYYTWFMRLLTAAAMRRQEERFTPFLFDDPLFTDMEGYCRREVEPMGKECDQFHIVALAGYLGIQVRVEYLDGRSFDEAQGLNVHLALENETTLGAKTYSVSLLYRPGHYDILNQ